MTSNSFLQYWHDVVGIYFSPIVLGVETILYTQIEYTKLKSLESFVFKSNWDHSYLVTMDRHMRAHLSVLSNLAIFEEGDWYLMRYGGHVEKSDALSIGTMLRMGNINDLVTVECRDRNHLREILELEVDICEGCFCLDVLCGDYSQDTTETALEELAELTVCPEVWDKVVEVAQKAKPTPNKLAIEMCKNEKILALLVSLNGNGSTNNE